MFLIQKELNIHFTIQQHPRIEYLKIININGNKNVFYFLNWIYSDAKVYLNRKYKKYLKLFNYYKTTSNNPQQLKNKSSKYRGVYKVQLKSKIKWCSDIKYKNKTIHLGRFINEIDAAKAYNCKAIELLGDKAILNSFLFS